MDKVIDGILLEVSLYVDAARTSYKNGDVSNAVYCMDCADIELMRARDKAVFTMRHGDNNA